MSIYALAWAFSTETGSPSRKAVLLALADRYNETEAAAWPSVGTLARATELHPSTVRRAIADLLDAGLLQPVGWAGVRPDRMTKRYRLAVPNVIHNAPPTGSHGATSSPSRGSTVHERGSTVHLTGSHGATRTISEPLDNPSATHTVDGALSVIASIRKAIK
jgi:DNA-binding transcriptional ArsR family regulator